MRLQLFAARAAFAALILALLLAAVAVVGVRLDRLSFGTGLALMAPATALGVIALFGALTWLWRAAGRNAGEGKRPGLIALFGALAFLYVPLSSSWYGLVMPPITDVSTDTDNPPHFVALAKLRTPQMNPLGFDGQATIPYRGEQRTISYVLHEFKNGEITRPYPRFFPRSEAPVKTLFWRSFETVKRLGWRVAAFSEKDGRIEATTRSPWFGRVFDIVLEVRPAGAGARVAVRAESRSDRDDHGYALRLVRKFLAANP
ncbi:MAG: hypothetical protein BGN85_14125 [Alphaproteobacteria bacterium 64-11]|nr:DUF1499 domain-containing protein [Alphaproteobacteria bacterium]OJU13785.1 MAG: hypothetical protein BGN85_14125 [Alphaproteobacteria bacterium 64-11]